jgi:hypothetical protein
MSKRRGKGDGSVFTRKDGRVVGEISVPPVAEGDTVDT